MEVFDTPANYKTRYDLPGTVSNDKEATNLELAGPKGPRRIVDETAGEVTFAEQLESSGIWITIITHLVHHRSCSDIWRVYPR